MKQFFYLLILFLIVLTSCEPLAPQAEQQVIVITNTPAPDATVSPIIGSTIQTPTRTATRTPNPTPTEVLIPTGTVPPCSGTEGTFFESELTSQISPEPIPYNIYLPPCFFESGRRFPYLILLHGSGYTYTQWADLDIEAALNTLIAEQTLPPMVVVMPEGSIYEENNVFEAGASFEDIVLDELIPEIEGNFCVWTWREGRAIGGISRGAFWAFSIAFRHPDMFSIVGGHSPTFIPDNAPGTHNPLALAENTVGIENLRIYLDNAQNDISSANVIVFSNTLRGRGIVHSYIINPVGGHDNEYWKSHVTEYLDFYGKAWSLDVAEFPSCQE